MGRIGSCITGSVRVITSVDNNRPHAISSIEKDTEFIARCLLILYGVFIMLAPGASVSPVPGRTLVPTMRPVSRLA